MPETAPPGKNGRPRLAKGLYKPEAPLGGVSGTLDPRSAAYEKVRGASGAEHSKSNISRSSL